MPTIDLFEPRPIESADAWHRVTAPGGYEWWHFDAVFPANGIRLVVRFCLGGLYHAEHRRRYADYLKRPTRVAPPVPADYPSVRVVRYEGGKLIAAACYPYGAAEFRASSERLDVAIGPHRVWRGDDGTIQLVLDDIANLLLRPRGTAVARESEITVPASAGCARHFWVLADPVCDVTGALKNDSECTVSGTGYHDHCYGTGPVDDETARRFPLLA
jgi:hypothetical protein